MPKPARKAALLDGAKRVICIVEHAPSQQIMQELAALLKQKIPPHYRFVCEDLSRKGGFLLRWHLKAIGRKSRAKKPTPMQAITQAQELAIHIPRGQMRQRTAVLTLPNGQRREATPDQTTSTNIANQREWFYKQFAAELAEHPGLKPKVKVKVNGHITLEGVLVAPKAIVLRPRNVVIERPIRRKIVPGERSPHVVKHQGESKVEATSRRVVRIDHTTALRARRTGYKAKATTRKAQPRKPPAAKARPVYVAPLPRKRPGNSEASVAGGFTFTIIHCLCNVVKGETFVRYMYNKESVQVPNTQQSTLRQAAKTTLPKESLVKALAFHPAFGTTNLLLVLHDAKRVPHQGLDILDVEGLLGKTDPIYTSLAAAKADIYRLAYARLMDESASLQEPPTATEKPSTPSGGATPPGNNLLHWQVLFCICGAEEGSPLSFHIADEATTVNNRKESLKAGASLQLQALGIAPQNVLAYRGINGLLLVFIHAKNAKGLQTRSWNETTADFPALASQHAALQQLADQNVAQATPAIHWQVVFCLCQQGKPPMFTIAQQATTAVANRASYMDAAEPSLQARGLLLADVLAYHPVRGEQNLLLAMVSAHLGSNWQRLTQATASKRLPALDNVRPEDLRRTLAKALERQGQTPPQATAQSATL